MGWLISATYTTASDCQTPSEQITGDECEQSRPVASPKAAGAGGAQVASAKGATIEVLKALSGVRSAEGVYGV